MMIVLPRRYPTGARPNQWPIMESGRVGRRAYPRIQNDQSALRATTIYIACPAGAGNAVSVLWGDGTSSALVCDSTLKTLTHNYTATGQYEISVVGDVQAITDFRCYSQAWISGGLFDVIAGLCTNLETLYLHFTGVTGDVAALAACINLVNLSMSSTGVTGDVAALAACINLVNLYMYSTGVTGSVAALAACTNLETLHMFSTGLTGDVAALAACTNLETLYLYSTGVTGSVAALAACTNLETLYMYSTGVTGSVAALAACTNLTSLLLYSTGVTGDVADLAACTNLVNLYLYSTGVTYTGPSVLPAWASADIRLYSAAFTGGAGGMVDQFLIDFAATAGAGPGAAKPLRLDGTNGARTAASDAAVTTLTGLGWVVQTN